MSYPAKLQQIIELFEALPDEEKRETLIAYADQAASQVPREGEIFSLEDVRKDEECTDTVGVFLSVDADRKVRFRINLGPQVQTLTRANGDTLMFDGKSGLFGVVRSDGAPRTVFKPAYGSC
jgi:cysteine desulfuration protein SufE